MAEQWLSIVEYARATGISDMTIRRRIRTGRIRAELKDGKYFIPVEIEPDLNSQRQIHSHTQKNNQIIKNLPLHDRAVERSIPVVRREADVEYSMRGSSRNSVATMPNVYSNDQIGINSKPMSWHHIPDHLVEPLVKVGSASVDARAVIEFCDKALEQAKETISNIDLKCKSQLEALGAKLSHREQEIKCLNQQIEDLQLLVQILERKKVG
jgi:polyhydroxyalkanoate synthesis regulator phasin